MKTLLLRSFAVTLYWSGLLDLLRFLGRKNPKIVLYHIVSDHETPFVRGTDIWIHRKRFIRHMEYIRKHYTVISLRTLIAGLMQGTVPPRSLVITFDDGFADNYSFAYPYLKQHNIPATIFLASDCITKAKPIWLQELCYLVNTIRVDRIASALQNGKANPGQPRFSLNGQSSNNLHKHIEDYLAFGVSKERRDEILADLYRRFQLDREKIFREARLFLDLDQIHQMSQDGIGFGSHGASHTPFSAMSAEEQEREVLDSKAAIQEIIGPEFVPFAYPFGTERHFTHSSEEIVQRAGYSCALTNIPYLNEEDSSIYKLARINVRNIAVPIFAFMLERAVFNALIGLGARYCGRPTGA